MIYVVADGGMGNGEWGRGRGKGERGKGKGERGKGKGEWKSAVKTLCCCVIWAVW